MRIVHPGDRGGLVSTAVTGVLVLSGLTCIGVAVVHRPRPPQPALSVLSEVASPAPSAGLSAPASPVPSPRTQQTVGPVLSASAPRTLAIPAIGVRSPLLRLGLDAKGRMETPQPGPHYNKAGWYRYSPAPGSLGPAVIAGHIDSAKEGPSVFFRLGSLRPRDSVLVTRADGSVAEFAVDEVRRYSKSQFPSRLVYGNTNRAALRLITCGGQFDRSSGNYLDNIVVFASLVRASGTARPTTGPSAAPSRR